MKKVMSVALIAALSVGLVACQGGSGTNNQNVGVVAGSLIGGLLGSQFGQGSGAVAATIGGAVLGGLLGGSIGQSMDKTDRMNTMQALNTGKTGRPTSWQNPDTGNYYQVTPTKTYMDDGQPCREYTTVATVAGKRQQIYGTACREADGSWQVVNQ